jgi:hypothetical protein
MSLARVDKAKWRASVSWPCHLQAWTTPCQLPAWTKTRGSGSCVTFLRRVREPKYGSAMKVFSSQIKSIPWHFWEFHHSRTNLTWVLWQRNIRHKFISELPLWRIWPLQLQKSLVTEALISTSVGKALPLEWGSRLSWMVCSFRGTPLPPLVFIGLDQQLSAGKLAEASWNRHWEELWRRHMEEVRRWSLVWFDRTTNSADLALAPTDLIFDWVTA